MPLISSATRFLANGQAALLAACCFRAATRGSLATSTTTPSISGLAANEASLLPSVPPPGTVVPSASLEESVRITVCEPGVGSGRPWRQRRVASRPRSDVAPFETDTVNWLPGVERAALAADPHVEAAGVVPGVDDDRLVARALRRRDRR